MPVNALSAGESNTEQQTLDDLNTENSNSTNESNATSAEVATDSNASEDTSISDISSNDIDSSEEKLNNEISLQSDNTEEDGEEPSTNNWELGLVFYDSTVDNGKTPLTSIDWDASDDGYGTGTPRVITVQINYKNTNAVTTYNPGDLSIEIPNLAWGKVDGYGASAITYGFNNAQLTSQTTVGANDSSHSGYDWNFVGSLSNQNYRFTNAITIEETANFEGSIKIVYNITPQGEVDSTNATNRIEQGEDECFHEYSLALKATLKDICESNKILFNYQRTYTHPWQKRPYKITKTAHKINSLDGLGENAEDYIWVKYRIGAIYQAYDSFSYPYMNAKGIYVKDSFPEGCVVYKSGVLQDPIKDNDYEITGTNYRSDNSNYLEICVGYPKSIYNDENNNLIVTNHAEKWGTYPLETTAEKLAEADVTINLQDFEFSYSGNLYSVYKGYSYANPYFYYQNFHEGDADLSPGPLTNWRLSFSVKNAFRDTGLDVKIGDDVLCITDSNNQYKIVKDDEYHFSTIELPDLKDGNGNILKEKYTTELWVRRAFDSEYELYDTFLNARKTYKFNADDGVVGFYFLIKDVKTDLTSSSIVADVYIKGIEDMSLNGYLYNFDYLEIYKEGELHNTVGLDSYTTKETKNIIAQHDLDVYGHYIQRDNHCVRYSYYNLPKLSYRYYTSKGMNIKKQNMEKEVFEGNSKITLRMSTDNDYNFTSDYYLNHIENLNENDAIKGFEFWDLLPEGMELASTTEEIIDSLSYNDFSLTYCYDSNKNVYSKKEVYDLIKNNTKIQIIKNWKDYDGNNTNRTYIHIKIDLSNNPIYFMQKKVNSSGGLTFQLSYNFEIPYDAFLEYGDVWTNHIYSNYYINQFYFDRGISCYTKDNGNLDIQEKDINKNGNIDENIGFASGSTTITSVISTHQDVTKYVQTDKSNFSTGTVSANPDSEYTYKLRVRTGENKVTNLIVYDSLEEYVQNPYSSEQDFITAYGTKKHWNGEFLGIDTSYAEKKYKVKPYYSEYVLAGNLYNEDGSLNTDWKEYSQDIDKSKVKALAFEYLNKDDPSQKAIVPAIFQTYVLVKMKAPPEENRKVLAYNGCRTQWNALDDYDRPVDFITGINSNIVKVSLSDYYDLTVNKVWNDENNKWGLRPDSVDIILKKDGTEVERKQITKDNLSVTFTDLLVEDSDRYTIEEESLSLYSSTIEYNELEDCYEVTNTLKGDIFKDISGTKTWVGDKESKRPESITIKLLKDGDVYRTTTTNAEREWKYSFTKVPIYNADETRCIYSVEEESVDKYTVQYAGNGKGLTIKFNSQFKTESVSYDYVEIYYKQDGQTYKLGRWGGTALAGQTVNVPTNDFYLYWRTDGSVNNYYGFSIDSIEAADVNTTGTAATLPNYTATELTGKEYPETAHDPYPNSQNLLWHYTGSFSSDVPAEGLFNIVNTYEGVDAVNLSFVKAIEGTDEAFDRLQLKKDDLYKFQVSMKNTETGNVISVPIDNKNTVTVNEVPVGTYVITEKDDMYFDFVSMETLNSVEGVTFEKVEGDYVLTITDAASDEETLQIKVNNKIEPDRPYEDKKERVNLFDYSSGEDIEEASLLSRIANFFKN